MQFLLDRNVSSLFKWSYECKTVGRVTTERSDPVPVGVLERKKIKLAAKNLIAFCLATAVSNEKKMSQFV
jgi:hypothetical protein